jgi:hypothetical protein
MAEALLYSHATTVWLALGNAVIWSAVFIVRRGANHD